MAKSKQTDGINEQYYYYMIREVKKHTTELE